jgi:hypothetical protein
VRDAAGLDLGRVKARVGFSDASGLSLKKGAERDVEIDAAVDALIEAKLLVLLERYPDPSAEGASPGGDRDAL